VNGEPDHPGYFGCDIISRHGAHDI